MADYIDRQAAIAVIDEVEAEGISPEAYKALRMLPSPWISVEDALPVSETEVLAVCNRNGYVFVVPAIYEAGEVLRGESGWRWNDIEEYGVYNEKLDDWYVPTGWWENRKFTPDDVYNNPIDCKVTHWMPLPDAPEVGK
jgi:hypothetical protein